MMNIQRLGSSAQFDETYIDKLLEFKRMYPNGVNEVWLATSYGFPPLDKHRENAVKLAEVAARLRAAGIAVSMQLSNSIGHGQYMASEDCSGLVYDGSPVKHIIGPDGEAAGYCFCWRDAYFRKYLREELLYYAKEVQPEYLWIDDDFRADNHNPVRYGCFCDDCLAEFNALNGTAYTREALVREILHGDKSVRKSFIEFLTDGLASLMEEICRTVHEVSPETSFGLQNAYHGYTGGSWKMVLEVMSRYSFHAPGYRPGGGVYNDHDPNQLFDKAKQLAFQNSRLPDSVAERIPEIENLPFTAFGKTPAGTALESVLNLASGCTGLSYSMMMRFEEEPDFYGRFYCIFDSMYPYTSRLAEVSRISRSGGLHYVLPELDYMKDVDGDGVEGFNQINGIKSGGEILLRRDAVPVTYESFDGEVSLLNGQIVPSLSDAEILRILSGCVLMDGESVEQLRKRGFDLGLDPFRIDFDLSRKLYEKYTEDSINTGTGCKISNFVESITPSYLLRTCPANARVLGKYMNGQPLDPIIPYADAPYGYASVILPTKFGGTAAVFAYSLFTGNVPYGYISRILNAADAIGRYRLPARVLSDAQACLFPRVEKHGARTLSVTAVNPTVGEESYTVSIRRPFGARFRWMGMNGSGCELSSEQRGDEYIIRLPVLAAYTAGTVFCEAD